jgi:glycosyltransferase involved in cell wall biosynthesis
MNQPKISIITPNYNYSQFIGQTIESLLNQDYKNIEHIIVDDGSTDNSVEIITGFCEKYPDRIKLIQQKNRGQSYAINVGLSHATGEIIGWINSDDFYCANVMKKIVEEFAIDKQMDIVFGDLCVINQNGNIIKLIKQLPLDKSTASYKGFAQLVASNTIFWRSTLIGKIGYFNEEFVCNMDGEYFSRLFFAGKSKHIKTNIAHFRIHEANSPERNPEKMKRYQYELNFELRRSYSNLHISKFIPYELSIPIRMFYKLKRAVLRSTQ